MYHTMVSAFCAREHASYVDHARHQLRVNGQLAKSVMADLVRFTAALNARHVTSTRAKDMPYDGSGILCSRTCVTYRTCATSAACQRPARNVRNGTSRPIYLAFERSTCHGHKSKCYATRWSAHLAPKNMRHMPNMRNIRCTPKAGSQRP